MTFLAHILALERKNEPEMSIIEPFIYSDIHDRTATHTVVSLVTAGMSLHTRAALPIRQSENIQEEAVHGG